MYATYLLRFGGGSLAFAFPLAAGPAISTSESELDFIALVTFFAGAFSTISTSESDSTFAGFFIARFVGAGADLSTPSGAAFARGLASGAFLAFATAFVGRNSSSESSDSPFRPGSDFLVRIVFCLRLTTLPLASVVDF
jgi:hypothetical protein